MAGSVGAVAGLHIPQKLAARAGGRKVHQGLLLA